MIWQPVEGPSINKPYRYMEPLGMLALPDAETAKMTEFLGRLGFAYPDGTAHMSSGVLPGCPHGMIMASFHPCELGLRFSGMEHPQTLRSRHLHISINMGVPNAHAVPIWDCTGCWVRMFSLEPNRNTLEGLGKAEVALRDILSSATFFVVPSWISGPFLRGSECVQNKSG